MSIYKKCYINLVESLGDIVACEPIVRYIKDTYKNIEIFWLVKEQYKDLLTANPYITSIIVVKSLYEADLLCAEKENSETLILNCHYDKRLCNVTGNVHRNTINSGITIDNIFTNRSILEAFSMCAGLPALNIKPRFYLKSDINVQNLPEKYVVFHCKSADIKKDWTKRKWNRLAKHIIAEGYHIIEIGMERIVTISDNYYHDYTDIRDLQKIAYIIKNCSCFIGIDSGFAHIANCFEKYSILLFGKYLRFSNYNIYSGNYKIFNKCTIIYCNNSYTKYIPAIIVCKVFKSFVYGKEEKLLNTKILYKPPLIKKLAYKIIKGVF